MRLILRKVLKLVIKHLFQEELDFSFDFKPLRTLSAMDEETVKTSKSNRYLAMFDKMLMNSKEVGEAFKKDNLVSVPIEAEQGILDDHPVNPMMEAMAEGSGEDKADEGASEKEQKSEGGSPVDKKAEPKPLKLPASGGDNKPKKEKTEKPEKPK